MKSTPKSFRTLFLCAFLLTFVSGFAKTKAEKMGWKLAVQSYTFHKFTLTEALEKTKELGVKYIEVYPGHKLGGKWGDRVFNNNLDAQTQKEIIQLASANGIRIVGTGVFVSDNMDEWRSMFQFAKSMNMEYISCEPPLSAWNTIEQLSKQYGIKVSVHNHPKPSDYWNPQNLLNAIQGRSSSIGSCADVGHWKRCELNHLDCLRQLSGRIVSLHFKDIAPKVDNQPESDHDLIWGQGVLNVHEMLQELQRQKFKGYFAIEYEYHWENSVPDIKQCIDYFNQTVDALRK